MNEAQQITRVVAHYLSFAGPKIDPRNLYNAVQLNAYLQSIEADESKPTTMHARLCRLKQGLTYLNFSLDPTETVKATKCLGLIANWSATLGKQAREAKRTMLEDMPTAPMTDIDAFAGSATMRAILDNTVASIKRKETVNSSNTCKIVLWLAGSLMHMNAQRPGAVVNATVGEYRVAVTHTEGRKSY